MCYCVNVVIDLISNNEYKEQNDLWIEYKSEFGFHSTAE